jgi:hypothetical protein
LGMDHSTFVRSFWHCNLQSQSLPCEALTSWIWWSSLALGMSNIIH